MSGSRSSTRLSSSQPVQSLSGDVLRGQSAVNVVNVHKWFADLHVLCDISLEIHRGEAFCICGPSGSGKSTLLRCINRLVDFEEGDILIHGESIKGMRNPRRLREGIGFLSQAFDLYSHMTALENVMLAPRRVKKVSKADAKERARFQLAQVGLEGKENSYPAQLSGGQQQRAAIARALAMEPKVMLLDEPTSALDPEMTVDVLEVIGALANTGITMIIVTHEMEFARRIADRVAFMDEGKVIAVSDPEAFFDGQVHPRVATFLSRLRPQVGEE